jgi:prepilin signal peptidase PulO-like enzyme (type II secretory pathway)
MTAGCIAILLLAGLAVGTQVNRAIYGLGWQRRPVGPWAIPAPQAPARRWFDFLPVTGWLGLRRESTLYGRGYWIRPLLVELGLAIAFVGVGCWITAGRLLPAGEFASLPWSTVLAPQLVAGCLLLALLTAATVIDLDQQVIPDQITISGTLLAILLATFYPLARLPIVVGGTVTGLLPTSPYLPPDWLFGIRGLLYGLAIHALWCLALMPKTCTLRYGFWRGAKYMLASIIRPARTTRSDRPRDRWPHPAANRLALLATVGWLAISCCWLCDKTAWLGLFTALLGLAGGGAIVWIVRVVSRLSLGREAMGFGDVTLLAMIGAFLGWQPALLIFFMAPLAGVLVALLQTIVTRKAEMAFGPYLSLAAVGLLVSWPRLWNGYANDLFAMGWVLPGLVLAGTCLMGGMLMFWRLLTGGSEAS